MKIIICDVGDAASAFVIAKNGYTMMIDCGSNDGKPNPIDVFHDYSKWSGTKPYVTAGGSYPLTLLHITHPDDDHVRNAKNVHDLLTPYLLRRNYCELFPDGDKVNPDYLQKFDKCYRYENVEQIDWGFEINETYSLSVETCKSESTLQSKVRNNSSIIRYIKDDGISILFCGDLEKAGWELLLAQNPKLVERLKSNGVTILIAPHHGHKSGFPKALFDVIKRVNVVIHSKDSEANMDGTDVSSQYSEYATGVYYKPLSHAHTFYKGNVLTTRSNGTILIDTQGSFQIYAEKASANHIRIN